MRVSDASGRVLVALVLSTLAEGPNVSTYIDPSRGDVNDYLQTMAKKVNCVDVVGDLWIPTPKAGGWCPKTPPTVSGNCVGSTYVVSGMSGSCRVYVGLKCRFYLFSVGHVGQSQLCL